MDLTRIADIIEKTIKQALEANIYRFGLAGRSGISNKIASGRLRDSVEGVAGKDEISILMNDYWKFVQSGRQPNKKGPPIDAIIAWIKERNLKPKDNKTVRQFAFAIQHNIKKFGIPAKPSFLDVAVELLFRNDELIEELGDMTVYELIERFEGI